MQQQFAWHEDGEVAPHRVLRVPFEGGRPLESTRMWTLRAAPIDPGHTGPISALAGGLWAGVPVFASGAQDMTVRLWDATTGRPVGATLTGHQGPVRGSVFVGPRRDVLVTADTTGLMLRWSPQTDGPRAKPLARLDGGIFGLATTVIDDREILGASTGDGRVELVDAASGQPYATLHTGTDINHLDLGVLDGWPVALVVSPHHEYDQGRVTVWDVRSGEPLHPPVVVTEESAYLGAFGMLDGRLVMVHGIDVENEDEGEFQWEDSACLSVYDAATRAIVGEIRPGGRWNNALLVVGTVVLIGSSDGPEQGMSVVDLRTGAVLGQPYEGHGTAGVHYAATLEVDGRVLVASSDAGNAVHIWDLEDRTRRLV